MDVTRFQELVEGKRQLDHNSFYLKQAQRIGLVERPKGFLTKRCPGCGEKLSAKRIPRSNYYSCSCGYEYVG